MKKKQSIQYHRRNIRILLNIIGVILVWRGVWSLADMYLFPHHPEISAIISILVGIFILYVEDRKLDELL